MRRTGGALVLVAILAIATAVIGFLGSPASAAGVPKAASAAPAPDPHIACYPPGSAGPFVTISTTTPFPGETITVSGANFDGNASVKIVLSPPTSTLAAVTTSAAGSFTAHVTIPAGASGTLTISVVGGIAHARTLPCPVNTPVIHILTTQPPPPGGHLSNTGVDILTGLLVALALLCVGLFLTRSGRRRHSAAHSADRD